MIIGLPDVGLVGLIATSYIISELNLEEIAYMDSDLLPPVVVLHKGLPHAPLRIYGNQNLIAVISELAVPAPVYIHDNAGNCGLGTSQESQKNSVHGRNSNRK